MLPTKKMLPMLILNILRKYTDENHTLDQKDILDKLKNEYDLPVDRKSVRRNIEELINMDKIIRPAYLSVMKERTYVPMEERPTDGATQEEA